MDVLKRSIENHIENKEAEDISLWLDSDHRFKFVALIMESDRQIPQVPASFVIEDGNGQKILDLKDFVLEAGELKENFDFLLVGGVNGKYTEGNSKKVIMGRDLFQDAKNFFLLLHEMGHAIILRELKDQDVENAYAKFYERNSTYDEKAEALTIMVSHERDAWAKAIRLARRLNDEYKINLFENFSSFQEFKSWVRRTLDSYESLFREFNSTKSFNREPMKKKLDSIAEQVFGENIPSHP